MCLIEHDSNHGDHFYIYCHVHNWLDIVVPVMAITVVALVGIAVWNRFRR